MSDTKRINDGGAAFPVQTERRPDGEIVQWSEPGMTLRAYFAAQAMAGLMSQPGSSTWKAACAFEMADAMLAQMAEDARHD